MKSTIISVRLPGYMAAALAEQKERTGCSVGEYVRRAVMAALNDAAPSAKRTPVLFTPPGRETR